MATLILSIVSRWAALSTGLYILLAPTLVAAEAASRWEQSEFTQVRLISATNAVGQTDKVQLGLQFQLEPEWKIYWRSPGDAGAPPILDFKGSNNIAAVEIDWPMPKRFTELGNLETIGYQDSVVLPITVQLRNIGEKLTVRALVEYQACKTICIPITATVDLELPSGPAATSAFSTLIARHVAKVPKSPEDAGISLQLLSVGGLPPTQILEIGLQADKPFSDPIVLVEGPPNFRFAKETKRLGADFHNVLMRVPVESRDGRSVIGEQILVTLADNALAVEIPVKVYSTLGGKTDSKKVPLLPILGMALLGGLILNLMPCVLPVLAIKVMSVIQYGGLNRRQVRANFLASASGIILSFLLLASGTTALKLTGAAVGWGMQFQEPLFLVFLILVITIFACNLFGFFNIPVPAWAGRLSLTNEAGLKTSTASSSFWIGALATLLATPCSAPFLGTAAGFALSRGPVEIFVVFATLGIGMATPYLVLAAIPAFATRLPKPGAWMIWVRNLMGVSLVGTIIWLLSVITAQIGYLGAIALATLMVTCAVILGLAKRREAAEGRFSLGAIGLISVIALIIPQATSSLSSKTNNEEILYSYWEKLDVSAIEPLVEAGNTVFVDITADWCLTCKVNKSLVLDKAEIVDQMMLPGIVAMRGDWTKPNPIIAEYLESFGRYGLPFNVIYGPATPLGLVLPELLSKAALLSGLQQARTTADSASKQ